VSEKLVIVTVAIAIPFGAAAGYVVGDPTNQGRRLDAFAVGLGRNENGALAWLGRTCHPHGTA
jgi:hypothetical protein